MFSNQLVFYADNWEKAKNYVDEKADVHENTDQSCNNAGVINKADLKWKGHGHVDQNKKHVAVPQPFESIRRIDQ